MPHMHAYLDCLNVVLLTVFFGFRLHNLVCRSSVSINCIGD